MKERKRRQGAAAVCQQSRPSHLKPEKPEQLNRLKIAPFVVILTEDDVKEVANAEEVENVLKNIAELVEGVLEARDGKVEGGRDIENVADKLDERLDEGSDGILESIELVGKGVDDGGGEAVKSELDSDLDARDDTLGRLDNLDEEVDLGLGQVGDTIDDVVDGTVDDDSEGRGRLGEGSSDGNVVLAYDGNDLGGDGSDVAGNLTNSFGWRSGLVLMSYHLKPWEVTY